MARQEDELPVASYPILRTAHDNQHPAPRRHPGSAENADHRAALATQDQRLFVAAHDRSASRTVAAIASMSPGERSWWQPIWKTRCAQSGPVSPFNTGVPGQMSSQRKIGMPEERSG